MAPSAVAMPPSILQSHLSPFPRPHPDLHARQFSPAQTARRSPSFPSGRFGAADSSGISNVVSSLKRRSSEELGSGTSAKLLSASHDSILGWIREQRMSQLPAEGSSYDRVLSWVTLFVERLHSFETAVEEFAGDSYLAAQLAYGYCALLLEVRHPLFLASPPHTARMT